MVWANIEKIYSDEIRFRLKNGWRVNIIFEKMIVNAELLTEDGKTMGFSLDVEYSDYVESLVDMLDNFENHELMLSLLMLLSYAPERKAKKRNWLNAIMNISLGSRPLEPKHKSYIKRWWSVEEITFDTVEFFKSIYNSIVHRDLSKTERNTIMFAMKILQKRGALWHPEVNKWASKIVARLMAERFAS